MPQQLFAAAHSASVPNDTMDKVEKTALKLAKLRSQQQMQQQLSGNFSTDLSNDSNANSSSSTSDMLQQQEGSSSPLQQQQGGSGSSSESSQGSPAAGNFRVEEGGALGDVRGSTRSGDLDRDNGVWDIERVFLQGTPGENQVDRFQIQLPEGL